MKAQGLPINVLIIAIIAIAVLIILFFIFFGGINKFQTGLSDCKSKGGSDCVNLSNETCKEGEQPIPSICKGGLACCIPIG